MKKFIFALTGTAAAFAVSAPATAQYYQSYPAQAPAPYGYQQPYGYNQGYGYQNNWLYDFRNQRYASMMRERVQRIRHDIRSMASQRILSRSEFYSLDREADQVERKIYRSARNGLSRGEARRLDRNVRNLEDRVIREANDWNRRSGVRRYNPYNYSRYWTQYGADYGYGHQDRDRDGRNDRYEDDRGFEHDHH